MKTLIILLLLCATAYAADMNNMIEATVDKDFVITLDANATTGYEWQLAKPIDDNLISLVNSEYIPDKTGLVGSGGKSIWTFKAIQIGKAQISFKYVRPWEKDAPPAKETAYIVNIQAPDTPAHPYWQEDWEEPSFGENGDEGDR